MDNSALFSVRTDAAEQIKLAMEQLELPKDDVGGDRYNHAVTLVENIEGVIEDQYFENATDGMKGLLSDTSNELTDFKANVAISAAEVKAALIAAAALISTTGFVAVPHIWTPKDAQDYP